MCFRLIKATPTIKDISEAQSCWPHPLSVPFPDSHSPVLSRKRRNGSSAVQFQVFVLHPFLQRPLPQARRCCHKFTPSLLTSSLLTSSLTPHDSLSLRHSRHTTHTQNSKVTSFSTSTSTTSSAQNTGRQDCKHPWRYWSIFKKHSIFSCCC